MIVIFLYKVIILCEERGAFSEWLAGMSPFWRKKENGQIKPKLTKGILFILYDLAYE